MLAQTITAIYDGDVFHPEKPLGLQPHTRYLIVIQTPVDSSAESMTSAFRTILECATDLEIPDLAEQHDHYLYGSDQR